MFFITAKKSRELASAVRRMERKDQRLCSKSGRLNDRLGPCIVSKHHQFKDEAVCSSTVNFGMLKALHHVSASNSLSMLD